MPIGTVFVNPVTYTLDTIKQLWLHSLGIFVMMANEFISNTDMEVMHREADFPNSRTPFRDTEPSGRRGVEDSLGLLQLDDSSTSILPDRQETGSLGGGLVYILPDTTAPLVFQPETGSSHRGNRCLHSGLEPTLGICQSSMVSVIDYTSNDSMREGHSGSGGTYKEDATMVSSPIPIVGWVSSPDYNARECGHITNSGGAHYANRSSYLSRPYGHYPATVPIRRAFRRSLKITGVLMEKQDQVNI